MAKKQPAKKAEEPKAKAEPKAKKTKYFKSALALPDCQPGYLGDKLSAEQIKAASNLSKADQAKYIEEK